MEVRPVTQRVHLLARAVIFRGTDEVLLAQARGYANTFLPGGHRDPSESIKDSLVREIREELGVACSVETYLGAVEWHYPEPDPTDYEINHVFLAQIDSAQPLVSQEPHLSFTWHRIDELAAAELEPSPLRELIPQLARGDRTTWWATNVAGGTHA
jgi:8-oxo-dGTP pyrophosphatase MutT (NUDIX family)